MRHPLREIRIGGIPMKGVAGLLFTFAFLLILLIGVPATRGFFALSLIGGLIMAGILYWWRSRPRS